MIRFLAGLTLVLASMVVYGGEDKLYMPFPEARITAQQWETYRSQVVDSYGASLRDFPDEHLEVMHSPDQVLHFSFTTAGHAAHPAWITRRVRDGSVDQIGYFAGDEPPFADLFKSYLALTNRTIESIPDDGSQP